MIRILAVTVSYNSLSHGVFDEFIASVIGSELKPHLMIIDNNSNPAQKEALKSFISEDVTVIFNEQNVGFGAACNQGIVAAVGQGYDYVLIVNNDVVFEDGVVQSLVTSMQNDGIDVSSPLILYYNKPNSVWYAGGGFSVSRGFANVHDWHNCDISAIDRNSIRSDFIPGCFLLMSIPAVKRYELYFDENFFVYCEDEDLSFRMMKLGVLTKVYADVMVKHLAGGSSGGEKSIFSIKSSAKNHIIFLRNHFPILKIVGFVALAFCKILWRVVVGRYSYSQFVAEISGMYDGVRFKIL